ncbi:MAG: 23S rRNA (uracil(1939)-C(5))-methyltransferase RlmD [Deltaproteobacteria bacterium]|nr:23S rRNA (uracil(1939)-C(5))-methyltransferase RlmD [Deltaproteobacteria bacterium]MBW2309583.1 23S rRNA (uracil(1939)-C(5))-methyltransferase RlmD [Deltaproteobacteria bacterium]
MDIKRGDTAEVDIEKVVYGGRGLAHVNGMTLFVAGAVPGDRVIAQMVKVKRKYAEARIEELIEASPHRIIPPCPYSDYCGGCTWQGITYEKQLIYKQAFVADSLGHIADITGFRIDEVVPSPRIFGYRNKMEFSFSDKIWPVPHGDRESSGDRGVALGLHVPGTFDRIIDIDGCLLQEEKGNEILREVKAYVRQSGMPVYGLKSHQGFWRYLVLRHSHCFDEWMVNVVTSEERRRFIQGLASLLRARFRKIVSIVNTINTRRGGTAVGEWESTLMGDGFLREKIGPYIFQVSTHSFFQTNQHLSGRLYEAVKEFASLTGKETVVDLYCGIGTVSAFLASRAARIVGLDISESAIADAKRNCELNGIDNCEFLCGDVKLLLSHTVSQPDVLITDPPRTGMHKKVIEQIVHLLPQRIIYISCNPTTMARDIALLKEHYELKAVQPIDLFPNTFHIEAVARLEKRRELKY